MAAERARPCATTSQKLAILVPTHEHSCIGSFVAWTGQRQRRETERDRNRDRDRQRQRDRDRQRQRQTERERHRQRGRERERDRQRQTERERDRQRQRETERDREIDLFGARGLGLRGEGREALVEEVEHGQRRAVRRGHQRVLHLGACPAGRCGRSGGDARAGGGGGGGSGRCEESPCVV